MRVRPTAAPFCAIVPAARIDVEKIIKSAGLDAEHRARLLPGG